MFEENDNYEGDIDFEVEVKKLTKFVPVVNTFQHGANYSNYYGQFNSSYQGFDSDYEKRVGISDAPFVSGYGVAKCTRCGKFGQIKNMHVSSTDIFCANCNDLDKSYNSAFNTGKKAQLEFWEGYYGS